MTPERSHAYSHVMSLLEDLAPAKLHPAEQDTIREAADALLFDDAQAGDAVGRLEALVDHLVDAERVMPQTGEDILASVEACGPAPTLAPAQARLAA